MKRTFFKLLCLGLVCGLSQLASAADYEELSYDDLVNQLQQKHKKVVSTNSHHSLDDLKIHAGVGLLTAMNYFNIPGHSGGRELSGFQISAGIDLFSPEWISELALKNFGHSESERENRSLREIDLRVLRRKSMTNDMGYRLGGGLGTRYLNYSDSNISVSEETPCVIAFGGLDSYISPNVSLGAELGFRSALIDKTIDKSALDLMVRLDTSF